ncbi:MAG: Nif3-like dinuclear metal center hexameric protein [Mollicutes bacterium PWAP]|nr:Nif3-like dinuclear metal center hexameric protein [Mollicutes bacterium PWAP]
MKFNQFIKNQNIFDFEKKEKWDFAGVELEVNPIVKKVLVVLDCTSKVIKKAIDEKFDTIITFHPLIFSNNKKEFLNENKWIKNILNKAKENKINIISIHTSYENMSQEYKKSISLAFESVEFKNGKLLIPNSDDFIIELNKKKLPYKFNNAPLGKGILLPGSHDLLNVKDGEIIFSSDIKWSQWFEAEERNITIVEIPHFIEFFGLIGIVNKINLLVKAELFMGSLFYV